MTVLTTTTSRNPIFITVERAMSSSAARMRKMRLKKVKQWVSNIWASVFPVGLGTPAASPASFRSWASASVSPSFGSA